MLVMSFEEIQTIRIEKVITMTTITIEKLMRTRPAHNRVAVSLPKLQVSVEWRYVTTNELLSCGHTCATCETSRVQHVDEVLPQLLNADFI